MKNFILAVLGSVFGFLAVSYVSHTKPDFSLAFGVFLGAGIVTAFNSVDQARARSLADEPRKDQ